jgi:hypothetical protein
MTMLAYRRYGVGAYSKRSKGMVFIIWLMPCGNFKLSQTEHADMRNSTYLKVHKRENFFGSYFEFYTFYS